MANLSQVKHNIVIHEIGPASSTCLAWCRSLKYEMTVPSFGWARCAESNHDHKAPSPKKLTQNLISYLTHWNQTMSQLSQGFAVFFNTGTELFPPGKRYLPPPHFKCLILNSLGYKEDQVRSSLRCCRDKDFYVTSLWKPAGNINTNLAWSATFGFSPQTSPGISSFSWETTPACSKEKAWTGQMGITVENWKTWISFPKASAKLAGTQEEDF